MNGQPGPDSSVTSQPPPPPEKDIFTTPNNESFYRGRLYKPLNPEKHEIRLLRVHPARLTISELGSVFPTWLEGSTDAGKLGYDDGVTSEESFICCQLLERISVDTMKDKYSALSYCAGSAQETRRIMIDGYWFNAFANLEHSLEGFRSHHDAKSWSGNLIWTDQACINQVDYPEKSHQVGFMRRIYENAANTYVVLSTPEAPMPNARDGVDALRPALDYLKSELLQPVFKDRNAPPATVEDCLQDLIYKSPDHRVARGLPQVMKFVVSAVAAKWWTRAWVFQEFIVSKNVFFICGSECLSSLDLEPFVLWEIRYFDCDEEEDDRRDIRLKSPMSSEIKTITDAIKKAIFYPTSGATKPLAPLFFLTLRPSLRTWLTQPYQPNFLTHLAAATSLGFQATDPRDMLYAFCGLSRITVGVVADYSPKNTIWKVYTDIAEKFLEANKVWEELGQEGPGPGEHGLDLGVLIVASCTTKTALAKANLPSWAPNWAAEGLGAISHRLHGSIQRLPQVHELHSHKLIQDASRSKWRILVVDAIQLHVDIGRRCFANKRIFEAGKYSIMALGMVDTGDRLWVIHGGIGVLVLRKRNREEEGYVLVGSGHVAPDGIDPSGSWVLMSKEEKNTFDEDQVIKEWIAQSEGVVQRIEIF